ncbi:MAG: glycosyltransferase [Candidatus Rokubacteria bacterium]|nr:glycosyltransferase [Candidatus Rokubacteria bacterium]MBI3105863.1 glycosyltransferase [Candidatus Rokubacteria bacterium]
MSAPIRVLELLVSSELGGGPAHVRDVIARLPRTEFAVSVGTPGGGPYVETFRQLGAHVVEVASDRLSPGALSAVVRLVRRHGIRLVHSHGKGAGLYGRLGARAVGIPAIHTFHGLHYSGYPPGLRWGYLALERGLARLTHTLVHVSESQAREARALGLSPVNRSRVIVNGIDLARVRALAGERPLTREALGLPPRALVIGTIARFDPVKALGVLLEGLSALAARFPSVALLLVGQGGGERELRARAAALGVHGRVVFAGAIPDAARCLPAMDVYASASLGEGLPLTLLEAMACEVPVVATRVPGHVDVVEEGVTGLLVPARDPRALAAAVGALLGDDARRGVMGAEGRARVARHFSADRMAAEVATLYREVLRAFPASDCVASRL